MYELVIAPNVLKHFNNNKRKIRKLNLGCGRIYDEFNNHQTIFLILFRLRFSIQL